LVLPWFAPCTRADSIAFNCSDISGAAYSVNPQTLPRHHLDAIEAELDALRARAMGSLGQADVDHIRRMVRVCRVSVVAGRGLLHFGTGPLSWLAGVAALAGAKILDNMEIGRNVMQMPVRLDR